jgi:hypothetical protein
MIGQYLYDEPWIRGSECGGDGSCVIHRIKAPDAEELFGGASGYILR